MQGGDTGKWQTQWWHGNAEHPVPTPHPQQPSSASVPGSHCRKGQKTETKRVDASQRQLLSLEKL